MTHDVFISYSSKDKPIADGICANLEAAGIRCWIAPRDIAPGEDWPTAITTAISGSKVMVLVFSGNSNSSADVGREIILAANENLTIIPFKIEDVKPEPGKQYYLARTHWLEAMNPPTLDQIQLLVNRIKSIVPTVAVRTFVQPTPIPDTFRSEPLASVIPISQERSKAPVMVSLQTISVSNRSITSIDFSPDGHNLVSANYDPTNITLWDVSKGTKLRTLSEHTGEVSKVAFSPDGRRLASGSMDNTILLWDTINWKSLQVLADHDGGVRSVAFTPNGRYLASASNDETIILWDVYNGTHLKTFSGHNDVVLSVAFSPDGLTLATGDYGGLIILWEVSSGKQLRTLSSQTGELKSLAFSPDGRTLASGSEDSTIILWEMVSGKKLHTLAGHTDHVNSVSFSPDGRSLASCGDGVILWDPVSGTRFQTFKVSERDIVFSVAFSPDGYQLASCGWERNILIWNFVKD